LGSQPGKIMRETLSQKTLHKNRADGATHGEGPEFKPQYHKKKTKKQKLCCVFKLPLVLFIDQI
jgi:hypothetical protein